MGRNTTKPSLKVYRNKTEEKSIEIDDHNKDEIAKRTEPISYSVASKQISREKGEELACKKCKPLLSQESIDLEEASNVSKKAELKNNGVKKNIEVVENQISMAPHFVDEISKQVAPKKNWETWVVFYTTTLIAIGCIVIVSQVTILGIFLMQMSMELAEYPLLAYFIACVISFMFSLALKMRDPKEESAKHRYKHMLIIGSILSGVLFLVFESYLANVGIEAMMEGNVSLFEEVITFLRSPVQAFGEGCLSALIWRTVVSIFETHGKNKSTSKKVVNKDRIEMEKYLEKLYQEYEENLQIIGRYHSLREIYQAKLEKVNITAVTYLYNKVRQIEENEERNQI